MVPQLIVSNRLILTSTTTSGCSWPTTTQASMWRPASSDRRHGWRSTVSTKLVSAAAATGWQTWCPGYPNRPGSTAKQLASNCAFRPASSPIYESLVSCRSRSRATLFSTVYRTVGSSKATPANRELAARHQRATFTDNSIRTPKRYKSKNFHCFLPPRTQEETTGKIRFL